MRWAVSCYSEHSGARQYKPSSMFVRRFVLRFAMFSVKDMHICHEAAQLRIRREREGLLLRPVTYCYLFSFSLLLFEKRNVIPDGKGRRCQFLPSR